MNTDPVRHRLGRRGAALLTLGIIWVISGIQDIYHHPPIIPNWWLYSHTPWWAQAAGWIITGAVACWAAFQRQGRDAIGWVAVYIMSAFALLVYGDAIAESVGDASFVDVMLSGWRNIGFVVLIAIMSGWREPVSFTGIVGKDDTA